MVMARKDEKYSVLESGSREPSSAGQTSAASVRWTVRPALLTVLPASSMKERNELFRPHERLPVVGRLVRATRFRQRRGR